MKERGEIQAIWAAVFGAEYVRNRIKLFHQRHTDSMIDDYTSAAIYVADEAVEGFLRAQHLTRSRAKNKGQIK
jgi:hypothetical protein